MGPKPIWPTSGLSPEIGLLRPGAGLAQTLIRNESWNEVFIQRICHRKLRWLGHLARMPDERLPKRVLYGHMNDSGVRGKSQKQWVGYVRDLLEDLRLAGLSIVCTWWRKFQDRAGWGPAMKCLLQL